MDDLLPTYKVFRQAIGGHTKELQEALRKLGKRVSLRWIYKLCKPSADVPLIDPYGAWWRWREALEYSNPAGAEFLDHDYSLRVQGIRAKARLNEERKGCAKCAVAGVRTVTARVGA